MAEAMRKKIFGLTYVDASTPQDLVKDAVRDRIEKRAPLV